MLQVTRAKVTEHYLVTRRYSTLALSGVNCTVVACGPFPLLTSEHSATLTLTGQLDTATLATLPSLNITSQVTALTYCQLST